MRRLTLILALLLGSGRGLAAPSLNPQGSLEILDRHGFPLRTFLNPEDELSIPISLAEVSPWAVLSTFAAEDKRFWEHRGVDPEALARAVGQDLFHARLISGASTLTQQLSRNLEPRPRSFWGKFKEALNAIRLEKEHSKTEILEAYFNRSPYGEGCQGLEAASLSYFGVRAHDLSLAQAALLAGLPNSPGRLNPLKHRRAALARQTFILNRLAEEGWVDSETLRLARGERILLCRPSRNFSAPHFCEAIKRWSPKIQGELRSSLDGELQEELRKLLCEHLRRLRGEHVSQMALVALDNHSGEVLAWLGSSSYFGDQGQVDGVLAKRQPGSSLKPFLYALGFSEGHYPAELVDDAPYTNAGGFSPKNYDRGYHGRVSLRQALACSYNIPAVKLVESLGVEAAYENFRNFGLRSLDRGSDYYGPGIALGDGEVTLLELACAYAALGREGLWRPARLTHGRDEPILWPPMPVHRVLDSATCYQVLDILSDNQARSPAFGENSALRLPFDIAVKTGTTKDYRDNWCVGTTPEWTIAVWAGNYDGRPMEGVSGVSGAGPLFHDAALRLAERFPPSTFPVPTELVRLPICQATGSLAEGNCGTTNDSWIQTRFESELESGKVALLDPHNYGEEAHIEFPREGEVFVIDPQSNLDEQNFRARAKAENLELSWRLDGRELGTGDPWIPLQVGEHQLELEQNGQTLEEISYKVMN